MTEQRVASKHAVLYAAALALLARREYTAAELRNRLRRRGFAPGPVEYVLDQLQRVGLQRDERYVECFFLERVRAGYGPIRIRDELKYRGVAGETISPAFERRKVDWVAKARAACRLRYGPASPRTPAEQVRRKAFLYRRGFTPEQVRQVLEPAE